MLQLVRKALPCLALAALARTAAGASGELPIVEAELGGLRRLGSRLVLEVSTAPAGMAVARVAVARATEPLGWFEPVDVDGDGRVFVPRRTLELPAETDALRAWFIGSDLLAAARLRWPIGAELWAKTDAVGLGAASVWLDAGSNHGVTIGDRWWRRVNGQPVARYDVRLVGREVSFCRVVPLVAGWQPGRDDRVALWPTPGEQRAGRALTAVSFVETTEDGQSVWVAAHPGIDAPAKPRLDFYRDGRYVGSGIAERRDPRFWYVRTLPAAGRDTVRVGDDAVIRTSADIRRRRFSARVFEETPTGGLVNAGEIDGLSVGDIGRVYREGREIGSLTLTRVQHDYSIARLVVDREPTATTQPTPGEKERSLGGPTRLQRLDEVRFGPHEEIAPALGVIERVVDGTLFATRITAVDAAPLCTPLAVRRVGHVIGVAILLDVADGRALGFGLSRSLIGPLAPGDELALPPRTE